MKRIEYFAPTSLEEAIALLDQYGAQARPLAGGTDLLVKMRRKAIAPACLVNLKRIPGLRFIKYDAQAGLRIGALTVLNEVGKSAVVRDRFPMLAQTALQMASVQVRNLATIGGNLCNASPSADMAPPLMALDARVKIVGKEGERVVLLEDFFTGPGTTVLKPDEILIEIRVPNPPPHTVGCYVRHTTRRAMDIARVGAAVVLQVANPGSPGAKVCADVRVVLGAVAPTPLRARQAEAVLRGQELTEALLAKMGEAAAGEAQPIDDVRASAWYRREMVRVATVRAARGALGLSSA